MNMRRLAALGAISALVAGATLAANPAQAAEQQTTEIFNANAHATALHLSILGTDLTLSDVVAGLDSSPSASALATEILTPLLTSDKVSAVQKGADGEIIAGGDACTLAGLEIIPGVARIHDATCPTARATILNGLPSSQGLGAEVKVDVSVSEILDTLGLRETVGGTHDDNDANNDGLDDTVLDTLTPLTGALGVEVVDDTVATVDQLVEDVLGLDTTVRIAIAPAVAETEATADTVRAFAKAQAVRIELLPVNDLGRFEGIVNDLEVGDPLLTIIISEAWGEQTYDRNSGKVNPAVGDAALARIKIGPGLPLVDEHVLPLLHGLGLDGLLATANGTVNGIPGLENAEVELTEREIVIRGPGEFTVLEGTPLETTIVLSAIDLGADGFTGSGVKLHALKGAQGGVLASLSDVTGGNVGEVEVLAGVQERPRSLARTGATPWIPLVGMVLLSGALATRRVLTIRADR